METSEQAAVLFANDAFYVAFSNNDIGAMEDLWSEDARVSCVHPGWNTIAGRNQVMASWAAVLADPGSAGIEPLNPFATIHGDIALVVCHEIYPEGYLIATNVFKLENGEWKMVHHQAGRAPPPPESDETDGDTIQ